MIPTFQEYLLSEDVMGMVANGVISELRKDGLNRKVYFSVTGRDPVFGFEVNGVKYKTDIKIPVLQANKMGDVPKANLIKQINDLIAKADEGDVSELTKI